MYMEKVCLRETSCIIADNIRKVQKLDVPGTSETGMKHRVESRKFAWNFFVWNYLWKAHTPLVLIFIMSIQEIATRILPANKSISLTEGDSERPGTQRPGRSGRWGKAPIWEQED